MTEIIKKVLKVYLACAIIVCCIKGFISTLCTFWYWAATNFSIKALTRQWRKRYWF